MAVACEDKAEIQSVTGYPSCIQVLSHVATKFVRRSCSSSLRLPPTICLTCPLCKSIHGRNIFDKNCNIGSQGVHGARFADCKPRSSFGANGGKLKTNLAKQDRHCMLSISGKRIDILLKNESNVIQLYQSMDPFPNNAKTCHHRRVVVSKNDKCY